MKMHLDIKALKMSVLRNCRLRSNEFFDLRESLYTNYQEVNPAAAHRSCDHWWWR